MLGKNLNFIVQIPSKRILKTQFSGQFQTGFTWQDDDNAWQNPYDIRSDWARNDQRYRAQGTIQIRPPLVGTFNFNFNTSLGVHTPSRPERTITAICRPTIARLVSSAILSEALANIRSI
jgi:hypothetical protein